MELPPPGQEPTPEWMAEFRALPLRERLNLTVQLAERLGDIVKQTFPQAAADVEAKTASMRLDSLSVEEKLALGDQQSADLFNIAMELSPESTLDLAEQQLASDVSSSMATGQLMHRLTAKGAAE